jgi:hypothetical protein
MQTVESRYHSSLPVHETNSQKTDVLIRKFINFVIAVPLIACYMRRKKRVLNIRVVALFLTLAIFTRIPVVD